MRDHLIGYLLDALEPAEHATVEARLNNDPQLRRQLELLSRGLEPLAADKGHYEPPVGLGQRTCQFVAVQSRVVLSPPVVSVPRSWSMADMLVAAGIFLAATLLFWPAMSQSRFAARVLGCQDHLRQLGVALDSYSHRFPRQFPTAGLTGNLNGAGIYAVILHEHGYLPQTHILICPASPLADQAGQFRLPTTQELLAAQAQRLAALRRQMGGSYGYSLGFVVNGHYQPPRDLRSATHALMADAPSPGTPMRSSLNHGGCGQNVLFGDLHVQFMTTCKAKGCNDHIFVNDEGKPLAGLHERDSVVGASDDVPMAPSVVIEELNPPVR